MRQRLRASLRVPGCATALLILTACSSAPAVLDSGGTSGAPTQVTGTTGGTAGTTSGTTGGAPIAPSQSATGSTGTGSTGGSSGATGSSSSGGGSTSGTGGATTTSGTGGGGTSGAGTGGASTGSGAGSTSGSAPAKSTLFTPAEDRVGISSGGINLCAHAALTYGQAFGTKAEDFNVFWTALNAEHGGIFGRKVTVTYENDDYKPETAVTAATACKAKGIFMLLGGIGFDQIPAVRNWAESNRMLYLHHTATIKGTKGQRFSFSELPTVERLGEGFAQLAGDKYRGKKIGIIERDSANWAPGVEAFKKVASKYGVTVVKEQKVAQNKGNYTDDLLAMKNAHADVVWVWLNALESTQVLKQAKAQQYNPNFMLFPFNLTSQTLGSDAMNPPLDGVAMYPAYSKGDYTGSFASYASDMKEFEAQYKKYDSGIDLSGIGGDLLFLNWVGQKALAVQLTQCGKDCTRNRFVDVLQSYKGQTPTKTACPIDFSADGHHGSDSLVFMQTYKSASGKVNWRETRNCVRP